MIWATAAAATLPAAQQLPTPVQRPPSPSHMTGGHSSGGNVEEDDGEIVLNLRTAGLSKEMQKSAKALQRPPSNVDNRSDSRRRCCGIPYCIRLAVGAAVNAIVQPISAACSRLREQIRLTVNAIFAQVPLFIAVFTPIGLTLLVASAEYSPLAIFAAFVLPSCATFCFLVAPVGVDEQNAKEAADAPSPPPRTLMEQAAKSRKHLLTKVRAV